MGTRHIEKSGMTRKAFLASSLGAILAGLVPKAAWGFATHQEHDDCLSKVLFSSGACPQNYKSVLAMLNYASWLCLDQKNGKTGLEGKDYLLELKSHGVKNLPELSDINIQVFGGDHRQGSHGGWDCHYQDQATRERWKKRKAILYNTVNRFFDFGPLNEARMFLSLGKCDSCDSFSALIYYTHIIGDYIYDSNNLIEGKTTVAPDGAIPLMAYGQTNVFTELDFHTSRLFSAQTSLAYSSFSDRLSYLADETHYHTEPLNNNTARDYLNVSEGLMQILTDCIPNLLEKTPFFDI